MTQLARTFRRFLRHPGGATAIEYGLLVALLSLVVIGAINALGVNLYTTMSNVSGRIASNR